MTRVFVPVPDARVCRYCQKAIRRVAIHGVCEACSPIHLCPRCYGDNGERGRGSVCFTCSDEFTRFRKHAKPELRQRPPLELLGHLLALYEYRAANQQDLFEQPLMFPWEFLPQARVDAARIGRFAVMVDDGHEIVNGVSLPKLTEGHAQRLLEGEHGELCVNFPEESCLFCRVFFGNATFEEKLSWLRKDRREQRLGTQGILPEAFLERLALSMVKNPELFAPIVQFLNDYGRSQ